MLRRIKNFLLKKFNKVIGKDEPEEIEDASQEYEEPEEIEDASQEYEEPEKVQPESIDYMNQLRKQLNRLKRGYDASLNQLRQEYNKKQQEYNQAFQDYQQSVINEKSDAKVKQAKDKLQPFEDSLRNSGYKLDEIEGYKRDDLLQVLSEMQNNEQAFAEDVAKQIRTKSNKLQYYKKIYLELLQELSADYSNVVSIEKDMKAYHRQLNHPYQPNLVHSLNVLTKEYPLTTKDLTITAGQITEVLSK